MPDLNELIKGLNPQALAIFKRKLAALPEQERQRSFSQLAGIPELSDVLGPMNIAQAQPQQQEAQPWWQKALSTVTAPFRWIEENITQPFGAAVASPWTKPLEESQYEQIINNLPWFQRQLANLVPQYGKELAEYSQWSPMGVDVPVLGRLDIKTGLETIPWLAVPAGAGILAKGTGVISKVAAPVARATATGAGFVKEVGGFGARAVGEVAGRTAGAVTARGVGAAAKAVGAVEKAITYPISKPLELLGKKLASGAVGSEISRLHRANGGATFNLNEGNLLGKPLYAVGNFPERTVTIEGSNLTEKQITGFLNANKDLLVKPELSFGSWVDAQGNSVMDVVRTLPNRSSALKLGSELGEEAIFSLGGEGEINISTALIRDKTKDILKRARVFDVDDVLDITNKVVTSPELKRRILNLSETIIDYTSLAGEQATRTQKQQLVQRLTPYVHEHLVNLQKEAASPASKLASQSAELATVLGNIERDLLSPDERIANIAVDQLMSLAHRREISSLPQIFGIPKNVAENVGVGVRKTPEILQAISEGRVSFKPVGYETPPEVIQQWMVNIGEGAPGLTWTGRSAVYRSPTGQPVGEVALHALPDGKIQVDRLVVDDKSLLKGKAIRSFLEASEQLPDLVPPPPAEMSKQAQAFWEKYQQKLGERNYIRVKSSVPPDIKANKIPPQDRQICIF